MGREINEKIPALVKSATNGDRDAFSEIVRIMMKPLTAFAIRMTSNRDTALDIVQESFVAAWKGLARFRGDGSFTGWMYRIVHNRVLNHLQKKDREISIDLIDDSQIDQSESDPHSELERNRLAGDIRAFSKTLPLQQQITFDLRFYSGLTFDEISKVTGKALGTVKTNYREAAGKLRTHALKKGWRQ